MSHPFRGVNVDPSLPPLDARRHAVLRTLVLYPVHNDGFAPELDELARMTREREADVEEILGDLVGLGYARESGAGWYPVTRTRSVPPLAVDAETRTLRRAG